MNFYENNNGFNFSNSINEKGLSSIAVGEARGTCLPKTSVGDELKGAGVGLVFLVIRDGRGLVRTEITRRSAGWWCRVATKPLTQETIRERVGHEPDDDSQWHRHETHVAILEDETPNSSETRPLQNDGNPVHEDGEKAVAEEAPEDSADPPRNTAALHLACRIESIQDDRCGRESECSKEQIVRVPPSREVGVRHRHHEADHEIERPVERPHEECSRTFRQLPDEVPDFLFYLHFASSFLWLEMYYRATMTRLIYCLEHSIFNVGSQA